MTNDTFLLRKKIFMVVVTTGLVDYSHYYISNIFYSILHTRKKVLNAKPQPQLLVEMIVNGTFLLHQWANSQ